jgi:actin-like ATPase involved in cell morphogenesis
MNEWVLAVDFGTTNTAAAANPVGRTERAREIKLASASTVMPSGVLVHGAKLMVGEVARNSAATAPEGAYVATPKQWFQYGSVDVGGHQHSLVELVAAVLSECARIGAREHNGVAPSELRLTHPAVWASARKKILLDAAAAAGLGTVTLVSEPVAAATHYAQAHKEEGLSGPVATYDLGGGTLDVAILKPNADGFGELAVDGIDPLGGETFDALLEGFVHTDIERRGRTELWDAVTSHTGTHRTLLDGIRNAKHTLSQWPTADIAVAAGSDSEVVTVTQDEFNALIGPRLMDSVAAVERALDTAGLGARDLERLYLVGGSSHIPLVAEMLERELGIRPATFDDPKTVTALGALHVTPQTATTHEIAALENTTLEHATLEKQPVENAKTEALTTDTISTRDVVTRSRKGLGTKAKIGLAAAAVLLVVIAGVAVAMQGDESPSTSSTPSIPAYTPPEDPTPTPDETAPPPMSEAELALLDLVPSTVGDCYSDQQNVDTTSSVPEEVYAAVACFAPGDGATQVSYWQYYDNEGMYEEYYDTLTNFQLEQDTGDCSTDQYAEHSYGDGRLVCWLGSDGYAYITWTDEPTSIYAFASNEQGDDASLYTWWDEGGGPY